MHQPSLRVIEAMTELDLQDRPMSHFPNPPLYCNRLNRTKLLNMKSLGVIYIDNLCYYALIAHKRQNWRVVTSGQCGLIELRQLAKSARRVIVGLNAMDCEFQLQWTDTFHAAHLFQDAYPVYDEQNRRGWQTVRANLEKTQLLLQQFQQHKIRVHALDNVLLATMRLVKHETHQGWLLIFPNFVVMWVSENNAIVQHTIIHYQLNLTSIRDLIDAHQRFMQIKNLIELHFNTAEFNPLIGLALWNVI